MSDPNDDVIRRIREAVLKRGGDVAPPVAQPNGDGTFSYAEPEDIYEEKGSAAPVMTDDGSGGALKLGVQEFATSGRAPLDMSKLRQDWGDARGGNDTSALDNSVRGVGDQFLERGTDGVDYPITFNEVDSATSSQDTNNDGTTDQLGKTLMNDAGTQEALQRAIKEHLYQDINEEIPQTHEIDPAPEPEIDPRERRLSRFNTLAGK
jgi:hypothetical protein